MARQAAATRTTTVSAPANHVAPVRKTARLKTDYQSILERLQERLTNLPDSMPEPELQRFTAQLESVLTKEATSETKQVALPTSFTQGRPISLEEAAANKIINLLRTYEHRRTLLEGALTTPQVAHLLGTSRQTPHDRVKAKTLLAISDNGMLRFPIWQFDPEGPNGVIAGLPEVLRALKIPPYSQASWLTRPQRELLDQTPMETLKRGKIKRVVRLAETVGVC